MQANLVEKLNQASIKQINFPLMSLPFGEAPDVGAYWMPQHLVSLYGTEAWDRLSDKQRVHLSQKEFALICSISCNGEKEAIGDIAKIMLKKKFSEVRSYLSHLIREENNHIDMFVEFCRRYGELTRFRYIYTKGDQCTDPAWNDLLAFIHLLVFEELGDNLNRMMAKDESLPPLVRAINRLHAEEEARHIAFGRQLVADLTAELLLKSSDEQRGKLHDYVYHFVQSRHYEYHNAGIYASVGIPGAYELRQSMVESRDAAFFFRGTPNPQEGPAKLLNYLYSVGLISEQHLNAQPGAGLGVVAYPASSCTLS